MCYNEIMDHIKVQQLLQAHRPNATVDDGEIVRILVGTNHPSASTDQINEAVRLIAASRPLA